MEWDKSHVMIMISSSINKKFWEDRYGDRQETSCKDEGTFPLCSGLYTFSSIFMCLKCVFMIICMFLSLNSM